MIDFTTKFDFTLPKGYVDKDGILHKNGVMRLATGADEILPLKDPRVQSNSAYHIFILLSRVITSLGTLNSINPKVIEEMFTEDMTYLQDFYNKINNSESKNINVICPNCQINFDVNPEFTGES